MDVHTGVPKGSLLGPLLVNIFINDLIFAFENCRLLRYADDTKRYLSNHDPRALEEGINRDLTSTTQWFRQNGMEVNPDKSQGLVLGNTDCDFQLECAGRPIPISSEIKLLGVTLDDKLDLMLMLHQSVERWRVRFKL